MNQRHLEFKIGHCEFPILPDQYNVKCIPCSSFNYFSNTTSPLLINKHFYQLPCCQQCCYFAKHPLILCAVHPTGVLGKTCADFEAHH